MITKITSSEYLKRYDNMDAGERQMVNDRVGQWLRSGGRRLLAVADGLEARLQNVMQLSTGWNDADCQAFMEGVRLMTAFAGHTDTWLPEMIYVKAAKRSIRKVWEVLNGASSFRVQGAGGGDGIAAQLTKKNPDVLTPSLVITEEQKQRIVEKYAKKVMKEQTAQQNLKPETLNLKPGVPARPRHIDQYVHLLPEGTQKRAAGYRDLMRELDVSREKLRIVMDDPQASDMDREQWAKRVSKLDGQIGDIRKELDAEWEKVAASGRVVVDELGMAHLVNPTPDPSPKERGVAGAQTGDLFGMKPEAMKPETAVADDNQRRAALLRKWLIDMRYGNKDAEKRAKYQEKWREKYQEMVRLGGMEAVTEKVREAARHYEIDIEALDKDGKASE
jgi:hypothetical protein